jgi:hypothetical protein
MNQDKTDITVILDRSGSMATIATDTIGGFNRFLEDQKKVPGECLFSLVQFDHEYTPVHQAVPIAGVPPLTRETFVPRGNTALLDAMGRSIVATGERLAAMDEAARPGKVIVVVITDGLENSSKEWTRDRVAALVRQQTEAYSWEFVYLGANQDAIATGGQVAVGATNAMSFAANQAGVQDAYVSLAANMRAYRGGTARSMAWNADDRAKQKAHGA